VWSRGKSPRIVKPALAVTRKPRLNAMTGVGARFNLSWKAASRSFGRGSYAENARIAATDSPTGRPFALPHKRFVHQTIDRKCGVFLGEEISYRQTVEEQGRPTVYDEAPRGGESSAALTPSTLWRWLSCMGGLKKTTRDAFRVIREANASVALHRQDWAVSPKKYRSEARRQVLEQALELLVTEKIFQRQFNRSLFPHFATGCGWS